MSKHVAHSPRPFSRVRLIRARLAIEYRAFRLDRERLVRETGRAVREARLRRVVQH